MSEGHKSEQNNPKRVVFVSYHKFSASVFRPEVFHQFFVDHRNSFKSYLRISGNWDHILKGRVEAADQHTRLVKVPSYKKNISLARIWSHLSFSWQLLFQREIRQADLVVVSAPPVFGAFASSLARLFKCHSKTVVDIVDIWPEAWPFRGIQKRLFNFFIAAPWIFLRTLYLHDVKVLCHAPFFKNHLRAPDVVDLPLCRVSDEMRLASVELKQPKEGAAFHICVLGSINNVLDVESLERIVSKLAESTAGSANLPNIKIEIIGSGERKGELVKKLKSIDATSESSVELVDHGASFDADLKREVLTRCRFGYNGYRSETAVGITYKSIEFLSFGCLLLNSLQGDLKDLVESENIGFNFEAESVDLLVQKMRSLEPERQDEMSENCVKLSDRLFSRASFNEKLKQVVLEEG